MAPPMNNVGVACSLGNDTSYPYVYICESPFSSHTSKFPSSSSPQLSRPSISWFHPDSLFSFFSYLPKSHPPLDWFKQCYDIIVALQYVKGCLLCQRHFSPFCWTVKKLAPTTLNDPLMLAIVTIVLSRLPNEFLLLSSKLIFSTSMLARRKIGLPLTENEPHHPFTHSQKSSSPCHIT